MPARLQHHRAAFTLIELLVVVTIIALMIALLLPALRKAKGAALLARCGSNLRQNGVAFRMYADEFRGWLPFPTIGSWQGICVAMDTGHWGPQPSVYNQGFLYPYLNERADTLFCPDVSFPPGGEMREFTNPAYGAQVFHDNWPTMPLTKTSYGMPLRWVDPNNPPPSSQPAWVYDIYREQNDYIQMIAYLLDYNQPPDGRTRKHYPIMGCLQEFLVGTGPFSYGGHEGEMSNLVFPDGRVIPFKHPFREHYDQIFRSHVWEEMTTMY